MRETVVTFNDIERAYATVKTVVHKAPLLTSWIFNEWSSSNVYCPNNTRSDLSRIPWGISTGLLPQVLHLGGTEIITFHVDQLKEFGGNDSEAIG